MLALVATLTALGGTTAAQAQEAPPSLIVYRCGARYENLCRVDLPSGAITQLTHDGDPDRWYYSTPSLTRDGSRLAYGYGQEMWASDADGGNKVRVSQSTSFIVAFRPDGGRIATIQRTNGFRVGMYTYEPDGSSRRDERGGPPAVVAWMGDRLLGEQKDPATGRQRICLIVKDSTPCERTVAVDAARDLWGPMVSPDGTLIAASACPPNVIDDGACALALYDPQTGAHLRDLATGTDPSDPAWSPDGTRIAFDRGGMIHVIAKDGEPGSEVPLIAGVQPTWGGPTS